MDQKQKTPEVDQNQIDFEQELKRQKERTLLTVQKMLSNYSPTTMKSGDCMSTKEIKELISDHLGFSSGSLIFEIMLELGYEDAFDFVRKEFVWLMEFTPKARNTENC